MFKNSSDIAGSSTFCDLIKSTTEEYCPEIGILFQDIAASLTEKPAQITHQSKVDDLLSENMLEFIYDDLGKLQKDNLKKDESETTTIDTDDQK